MDEEGYTHRLMSDLCGSQLPGRNHPEAKGIRPAAENVKGKGYPISDTGSSEAPGLLQRWSCYLQEHVISKARSSEERIAEKRRRWWIGGIPQPPSSSRDQRGQARLEDNSWKVSGRDEGRRRAVNVKWAREKLKRFHHSSHLKD